MILEGKLTLRLEDGRELSALVFGVEHAERVLGYWSKGECPETLQTAGGYYLGCVKAVGHAGRCSTTSSREDDQ